VDEELVDLTVRRYPFSVGMSVIDMGCMMELKDKKVKLWGIKWSKR
jgi:hypothetical protein